MKRTIRLSKFYPHPPERVWKVLTSSELMSRWLMKNDFQPRVGHTFTFRAKPQGSWNGIVNCEVKELVPPSRLVYSWAGEGGPLQNSRVTWTLTPKAGGTQLSLEHDGFEGIGGFLLSFLMGAGWKKMLRKQFAALLDDENAMLAAKDCADALGGPAAHAAR